MNNQTFYYESRPALSHAIAVVSHTMPRESKTALEKYVRLVLTLPPDPSLPAPVSSHPDMLLFSLDNTIVTYRTYYDMAKGCMDTLLAHTGLKLVLSDHPRCNRYPGDVGLNALPVENRTSRSGGFLLGRVDSLAPEVLALANAAGYRPLSVKQGYAGCSGLAVCGTLFTGDKSLYRAALSADVPGVWVDDGTILLPGYNHGFLGGAGGVWNRTVLLCGTPEMSVLSAIRQAAVVEDVICLGKHSLFDCGGIRLFPAF